MYVQSSRSSAHVSCVGEGVVVVEEIASVGIPKLFGNDVKVDTIHLNSMLSELYCDVKTLEIILIL